MAIQTLFGSAEPSGGLLDRLKAGIQKTRAGFVDKIEDALQGRKEIDAEHGRRHASPVKQSRGKSEDGSSARISSNSRT